MANAKELKWGYINPQGEMVIAPKFDGASDFCDGLAVVKIDWERICINKNGDFVDAPADSPTPTPQFESGYAPHYELHDGLIRFVENQKFGYKDKDGNVVIKPQYFDATDFSERLACVKKGKTSSWGYIDTTGRIAIPANYRQAKPFNEGLAAVLVPID